MPIESWGGFAPETVVCLRLISRATHACFDHVVAARTSCNNAVVRGEACDEEATDARVADASRTQRLTLTSECSQAELMDLGYRDVFDASADLFNACVTQARGAVSSTYAPALAGTPSPAAAECMVASAAYARKVMRSALQRETPVMERIASRSLPTEEKIRSIARVETDLASTRLRWANGILDVCPDFVAVYGRSVDSYLRTLKQRTDCVLQKTYIHTRISCPSQICGNGIPEGIEECDDGNRDNTDTCRTDCTRPL